VPDQLPAVRRGKPGGTRVGRPGSGHPDPVSTPDGTGPDTPQPRDIALEQASPELLEQLEEESDPEPVDEDRGTRS
jgi:hypothetical protein